MATIEGNKKKVSVVEVTRPGNFSVEVSSSKPKNTAIVPDTRFDVVEVSQKGVVGPQGLPGPGIIVGSGAPSNSVGILNDLYFDTNTDQFWGPKGELGWPSEPFFTPTLTTRYVHAQPIASSTWTINHELGGYPSVTVVDSASTVVMGEISYISTSQVQVSFTAPFSGFAYLT